MEKRDLAIGSKDYRCADPHDQGANLKSKPSQTPLKTGIDIIHSGVEKRIKAFNVCCSQGGCK